MLLFFLNKNNTRINYKKNLIDSFFFLVDNKLSVEKINYLQFLKYIYKQNFILKDLCLFITFDFFKRSINTKFIEATGILKSEKKSFN